MKKQPVTGVLLLNLGGPDSLDAVEPFLRNLFSDREIIRLSPLPFLQSFIAGRIASSRALKVRPRYEAIGGRSPILPLTIDQATALQEELARGAADAPKVYVGMRYWTPYIDDALEQMAGDGIERIVVLPLYPHYSRATTGSCFAEVRRAIRNITPAMARSIDVTYVNDWFDQPDYIAALTETLEQGLAGFSAGGTVVDLLFSAHSLPQSFIDQGDPYRDQLEATMSRVLAELTVPDGIEVRSHLSFQSRSGPVKWMEPATDATIERLAADGCKALLIVPLSFVSDHIETLYELDVMYRELAESKGIEVYRRAPSLNSAPRFIKGLAELVRGALAGTRPEVEPEPPSAAVEAEAAK